MLLSIAEQVSILQVLVSNLVEKKTGDTDDVRCTS